MCFVEILLRILLPYLSKQLVAFFDQSQAVKTTQQSGYSL